MTQVIVTNLMSFINYTFKVYARNRVSEIARKQGIEGNLATILLRTLGASEFALHTFFIVIFLRYYY